VASLAVAAVVLSGCGIDNSVLRFGWPSGVTPQAERRGSSIQQIGATDERVVLDPVRIRQSLEELLVNALKFSPPASAVVIGQRVDDSGIHIVVSDSGPGLTSLERTRVFDPFYRTTYAREHAIQGFGIGLSVVRNAVVAHGGRVRVGASASGGTAMAIVLPTTSPHERPLSAPVSSAGATFTATGE